eukprot:jgi/Astpho2/4331/fgenesh1_pg.00065_%23_16_t
MQDHPSDRQEAQQVDQRQHFQQGLPQYPAPPPQQYYQSPAPSGGMPPLFWAIVGGAAVLLFNFFNSIRTAGGIQAWLMQQAMKTMMKGQGGKPGAANPFGGAGGFPGGMPGMPQGMPGMPPGFPQQGFGAQGSAPASRQPPVDVTAQASSSAADRQQGAKFQQRQEEEAARRRRESGTSTSTAAASGTGAGAETSSPGGSSFSGSSGPTKKAAFVDVEEQQTSTAPRAAFFQDANGQAWVAANTMYGNVESVHPSWCWLMQDASSTGAGAGGNGASTSGSGGVTDAEDSPQLQMMEKMMRDPNMQKLLYPYLPPGMQNPETFEWMLKSPDARKHLSSMLAQQGGMAGSPQMEEYMRNFNMNPEEAFSRPEVGQAVMDISQNPANLIKYQDNPEIMKVLAKLSSLFPQQAGVVPDFAPPEAPQ